MPDVEITYNNSTIVSLSDSGTEVLETSGTYLTDDITVQYTKSGGGGGTTAVTIAVGSGSKFVSYVDGDGNIQNSSLGLSDPFSGNLLSGSMMAVLCVDYSSIQVTGATLLYHNDAGSKAMKRYECIYQVD